jgi:hypothetical protein
MNHLTIKIFDISLSKVTSILLDICTTKGFTAADIFLNDNVNYTKSDTTG